MQNKEDLEKKLQQRYISQGMEPFAALCKASEGVRKMEQKKYTKEYFLNKICKHDWMLQRLCEHIVLRPNDNKRCFGEKGFANMVEVVEEALEQQKDGELYCYYYDMKNNEHDFHDFERWQVWGRKVGVK